MTGIDDARTLDGSLLLRGSEEYERARAGAVWNERKPDRHPEAILRARTDDDVVRAVHIARAQGWSLSVRSGGHSWIGNGVRDGALLVDLAGMTDVAIDRAARRVRARPAVKGKVLNALLAEHALVFPSGHCPSVGIGGFLLGGGYGWNSRALGPACFSVEAVDVVLPSGELVHADDGSHPDLMWAVRGAGPGFFGIVTRFHLRVYPQYDSILRSAYVFPRELQDEVLAWSYETVPAISPWLEMSAKVSFTSGIDTPTTMLTAAAFCAGDQTGDMLRPIENAPFISKAIRRIERVPSTIDDLYDLSDTLTPAGYRYAVDGVWTDATADDVLNAGKRVLDWIPTRKSFLLWMLWGHYPERKNACWSTQSRLYFSPNAVWTDPTDDLRCEQWAHSHLSDLDPIGRGTQFADANPADRPAHALAVAQAERLEELRAEFDPEGLMVSYLTPGESTTALAQSRN